MSEQHLQLNVLIPLGGSSNLFDATHHYPKPLIEIVGRPMIQWVVENFKSLREEARFIFVLNAEECVKYHLDDTVRLLAGAGCEIIRLERETKGAVCSCLLAIEHIDNDQPLVIANGDQIIDTDLREVVRTFQAKELDAGVICFDSVHPKWSYIRLDSSGRIVETAEKRPISRYAVAGFYFFRRGADFVSAAFESIRKEASVNGAFYIAPVLNEMVLADKAIGVVMVGNTQYHSFYSPQKIDEFERYKLAENSLKGL